MQKTAKNNRKRWFRCLKAIIRVFKKKPNYVFLGEEYNGPALLLSNHSAASGPLAHELYTEKPIRIWGTYEMNSGIRMVYRYLSNIYFHKKKHFNIHLSRFISIFAAPLLFLFYRGLRLIPTYPDYRFRSTLKESMKALEEGQTLLIFPEDSSDGYHDELTKFNPGCLSIAQYAFDRGYDLPIFVAYYQKKTKNLIFDKPFLYSELKGLNLTKEELLIKLRDRCNELGKMEV